MKSYRSVYKLVPKCVQDSQLCTEVCSRSASLLLRYRADLAYLAGRRGVTAATRRVPTAACCCAANLSSNQARDKKTQAI
eukprot:2185789-Pleurochrysis_carterae.AAC.1